MSSSGDDHFFNRSETHQAIVALAAEDPVVLFIGAGVPASLGLPTWYQLIERLLLGIAKRDPTLDSELERREYSETLQKLYAPEVLGSLIRHRTPNPDALADILTVELYERRQIRTGEAIGNYARAVCQFILTRAISGRKTLVLTTNYDDTIEHALETDPVLRSLLAEADITEVRAMTSLPDQDLGPHVLPIYHLHGYIARPSRRKDDYVQSHVVFSALDYGRVWTDEWSFPLLENHWVSSWFFVGMSFTDHHISFYARQRQLAVTPAQRTTILRRPVKPKPTLAVFSLQARDWKHVSPALRKALVDAEQARLSEILVTALPTDYFFQDAQMLREVCLRLRGRTRRNRRYDSRLNQWRSQMLARRWEVSDEDRILLGNYMSDWLRVVRSAVEELTTKETIERFKTELWCRDVSQSALFQIGSSEFVYRDPLRSRRFPLTTIGDASAAVAAFTQGKPDVIDAPAGQQYGRWKSFFGTPISLAGAPWFDLPVGALVIASTETREDGRSTLQAHFESILRSLEEWRPPFRSILDPELRVDDLLQYGIGHFSLKRS